MVSSYQLLSPSQQVDERLDRVSMPASPVCSSTFNTSRGALGFAADQLHRDRVDAKDDI